MTDLLEKVLEAHGGVDNWRCVNTVREPSGQTLLTGTPIFRLDIAFAVPS